MKGCFLLPFPLAQYLNRDHFDSNTTMTACYRKGGAARERARSDVAFTRKRGVSGSARLQGSEQLLLDLGDPEPAPAAPGRPATAPNRSSNPPESARSEPLGADRRRNPALRRAVSAPRTQSGIHNTQLPPKPAAAAGGDPAPVPAAIPARCPVVNRPGWCVRSYYRHWSNGCAHPGATRRHRRNR